MWFKSPKTWRCSAMIVLALVGCSESATDESDPGAESSAGGSTEVLGTGGSANESDAARPGVGGDPAGGGGSVTMGEGGSAGRALADAAVPIFTTGPDDPIPPDPG